MLKRVVVVAEVLAVLAAAFTVVMLFVPADDAEAPAPSAASGAADGAAVYAASCAGCHGAGGEGVSGPALGGGAVVEAFPDEADQVAVVTNGRGSMPAFGDRLTPDEITAVVAYTRNDL